MMILINVNLEINNDYRSKKYFYPDPCILLNYHKMINTYTLIYIT